MSPPVATVAVLAQHKRWRLKGETRPLRKSHNAEPLKALRTCNQGGSETRTARIDRLKKLRIYARERVLHAWLVDPIQRTLEVLRLEGERWTILAVHGGDEVVRPEPFDATDVELASLWASGEPAMPGRD